MIVFFLETDTIDEGIREVYQLASKYKNMKLEAMQNQVQHNFESIFKLNS